MKFFINIVGLATDLIVENREEILDDNIQKEQRNTGIYLMEIEKITRKGYGINNENTTIKEYQ